MLLTVYNTATTKQRDVVLTPSSSWPGEGLLGIKIKLNTYDAPRLDLNVSDVYNQVSRFIIIVLLLIHDIFFFVM